MANSSIIGKAKNIIIKELINDDNIVTAIDPAGIKSNEELINKYIFNFHQNPETIADVKTFITVQVHIPEEHSRYGLNSEILINSHIEIWIISHEEHMRVNNIPKVTENRNDYLSRLIDTKFNGSPLFGIGKLKLVINLEGACQKDYLYRQMIFKVSDVNNSPCNNIE